MSETQLCCQKCRDPVLLENSHASGRNALKRVCTGCASTDKALQRSVKTKAKGDDETPAEAEIRSKAEKVKAEVAKMSNDERADWYKKQKTKREAEGFSSKRRTFESGVGIVEENKTRSSGSENLNQWQRYRDWAVTERSITGCVPEELPGRWKREIEKPTSETKTVNGEVLLKIWKGVEDRDGQKHSITAGLKQRCDLHSADDLEDFQTQGDMRLARGENILKADRLASDATGTTKETTLLQIQQDMEATARQRQLAEQQLYEEAEKIEEKRKLLATAKPKISSAALEKLQFENCIGRAKTSCDGALNRFLTSMKTMKLEIEQLASDDETTKTEMNKRASSFTDVLKKAEKFLEEKIEHPGLH